MADPKQIPELLSATRLFVMMGEVGLIIIIPLAVMILLGIAIDSRLGTSPLFAGVGTAIAALLSATMIAYFIKNIQKT